MQTLPSGQIRLVETEVDVWLADRRLRENYLKSLDRDPPSLVQVGAVVSTALRDTTVGIWLWAA